MLSDVSNLFVTQSVEGWRVQAQPGAVQTQGSTAHSTTCQPGSGTGNLRTQLFFSLHNCIAAMGCLFFNIFIFIVCLQTHMCMCVHAFRGVVGGGYKLAIYIQSLQYGCDLLKWHCDRDFSSQPCQVWPLDLKLTAVMINIDFLWNTKCAMFVVTAAAAALNLSQREWVHCISPPQSAARQCVQRQAIGPRSPHAGPHQQEDEDLSHRGLFWRLLIRCTQIEPAAGLRLWERSLECQDGRCCAIFTVHIFEEDFEKNEDNWTGKAEIRQNS